MTRKTWAFSRLIAFLVLAAAIVACTDLGSTPPATVVPSVTSASEPHPIVVTPGNSSLASPISDVESIEISTTVEAEPSVGAPTPIYSGPLSPPCGLLLKPLPARIASESTDFKVSDAVESELRQLVPTAAWPALQRMLDAPDTVGLVAFQAGREAEGVYLNASVSMPLASVAKLIVLVAYTEAVATGELDSLEQIPLAELDRFYLPNFDLGAHRRAVAELRELDRVHSPDDNPTVSLDDVAWMMIRHSSNAASDYLHLRLGQRRIEETAVSLGLNDSPHSHSAPCTFLGQFLMMGNHTRDGNNDQAFLSGFANGDQLAAEAYGREVALLADVYVNQEAFREAELDWRSTTRRPTIGTQRYFAGMMASQGTAGAYAALMLRLAHNGLSNADSSYQARRILEWTNLFAANQEIFSNVGYKNGSLPGVLTTAYYAYRWGESAPVIVVLFYRDLPQQTYRQWRNELPHDELARWLLADPAAIPALSATMSEMIAP